MDKRISLEEDVIVKAFLYYIERALGYLYSSLLASFR
ncbi:hypothetical protein GNIT_0952 [Glaciecola nitratireducens FR1064]|uniref:Uncharacterized protein n=1 Tax=Glaciecola nitratireducens (strain JCM 12485 / KCTC 12276 / FR1064) TaxID=1085623 RepID=G4QFZ9_GLANF|nr:hypothetical protein GNIT_0952 [Glaciecola nitratireducens FR1064]